MQAVVYLPQRLAATDYALCAEEHDADQYDDQIAGKEHPP